MLPRALGMGANQITFLVNTALASTLAVGAVVSYNVAFNVLQIPLGVIGLPLGIVLLPSLSRALARGEEAEFGQTVVSSLRLLLWAMLLVAAVGIVARDQVVELLFGWGFDEAALAATAACLGVFLLGLPAHALNVILARAFYSGQDTITPVSVAIASVVINVLVSLATIEQLGLPGLALGIAVGAWFEAVTLTVLLQRRHATIRVRPVVSGGAASLVGALAAGLVAALVLAVTPVPAGLSTALGLLLVLTVSTAAASIVYLAYSRLVRLPELPRTVGPAALGAAPGMSHAGAGVRGRPDRPRRPTSGPRRAVVRDEDSAPDGWDERAVRVPGGHVMQSGAWAAYRASLGSEPRFLTFDDGRVALAMLRRSPLLPGVEAVVRRGPAHRGDPGEVGAARAVGLADWAADLGARDLFLDPERPQDDDLRGGHGRGRLRGQRRARALHPRHASGLPARRRREPRSRPASRSPRASASGPPSGPAPSCATTRPASAFPGSSCSCASAPRSWASRCSTATTTCRAGGPSCAPASPACSWPSTTRRSSAASSSSARAASTPRPTRPTTRPVATTCRARCTSCAGPPSAMPSVDGAAAIELGGVDLPGHRAPPQPGEPGRGLYEHKRGFGAVWVERAPPRRIVLRPGAERLARGRRLLIDAARWVRR